MAAEARIEVHHGAPRCQLGLFDAAAGGLADWRSSTRRPSVGASRSVGSTRVIPTQRAPYRSLYHDFTEERELAFARTRKREKWGLSGVPRDESVAAG